MCRSCEIILRSFVYPIRHCGLSVCSEATIHLYSGSQATCRDKRDFAYFFPCAVSRAEDIRGLMDGRKQQFRFALQRHHRMSQRNSSKVLRLRHSPVPELRLRVRGNATRGIRGKCSSAKGLRESGLFKAHGSDARRSWL